MIERRRAAAHVFVADVSCPILSEADEHHLLRVLRLRVGEMVAVSDGAGSWRMCTMRAPDGLEVVDEIVHRESPNRRPITVVFGVTKSDKPETVVQKLTEIGVDHIVPVLLDRSVVRWDGDKIDRQHERLQRISREAAMQSRHVFLPTVHRIENGLESCLRNPVIASQANAVALAEPDGAEGLDGVSALVVGPEGGFSDEELALVDRRVRLPGGILRAETAAIAAGVLLADARGPH